MATLSASFAVAEEADEAEQWCPLVGNDLAKGCATCLTRSEETDLSITVRQVDLVEGETTVRLLCFGCSLRLWAHVTH